jgi:hypothetical protein
MDAPSTELSFHRRVSTRRRYYLYRRTPFPTEAEIQGGIAPVLHTNKDSFGDDTVRFNPV